MVKIILKAKGPGRGWWGPPRGTHTAQPGASKKSPAQMTRAELEKGGYTPVFRGVGKKGIEQMRPSPTGQMGPGIYFYDTPLLARAYAEPGGGVITAFVKPGEGVKVVDIPQSGFTVAHKIVVARDASLVVRRGTIPTEKTILQGYGQKARDAFQAIADAALEERGE